MGIRVLSVPMDLGADRRGVDMGPSGIRYAGLATQLEGIGHSCADGGDIPVPRPKSVTPMPVFDGGRAKFHREARSVCADISRGSKESGVAVYNDYRRARGAQGR
jgi:arginase (EC 3.5.3.1)